jgi:hypothetical protein
MGDGAPVTLPLFTSLRGYDTGWLRGDVVAGLMVWAVPVPEALAYASIAGVSPVVGLYAALAPVRLMAWWMRDLALVILVGVGHVLQSRPHPGGVISGSAGGSGSRRTSTSSRPSDWMRSSSPDRAAWSWTGPCSTVATGSTDARMPSNAATSEALRRPRTRIS